MHRTTLQLEGGLEVQLRRLAHKQRRSLRAIINEVLRYGLEAMAGVTRQPTRLEWHTAAGKPAASFNPADRSTYLDHLDEGF